MNAMQKQYDVVTIGECMLRLSPPNFNRMRYMRSLDVNLCGAQHNIAANCARLGLKSAYLTKLPDNAIGMYARDFTESCGVDVSHIQMVPDSRLGINFVEFGMTPRASAVVYDRKYSAASTIGPNDFDWSAILKGTKIAYTDGILPALSQNCKEAAFEFVRQSKKNCCKLAFDVNYREFLWSTDQAKATLSEILKQVDILVTGQWHSQCVFGIKGSEVDIAKQFQDKFGCQTVAITLRQAHNVRNCTWNVFVLSGNEQIYGKEYQIEALDRFGGGDAWTAGFLYGILKLGTAADAVNFANAACALKHTTHGDVIQNDVAEITEFMRSNSQYIRR
jgi:2-dehydro-3-deoxygluconokinase